MRYYLVRIHQLLAGIANSAFPSEEDRAWNAWLDLDNKKREPRDLQLLLTLDVRKEFKARALTVLLAPDLRVLPFRWHGGGNYVSSRWLAVRDIPWELVRFAGELVCQNIDYALNHKNWEVSDTLFAYNNLILQFLAVLPEDDELAQRLFSRYQINDPVAYFNMDASSGYNPLYEIFCAKDVPLKWKQLADKQMQDRIVAEAEGRERPREDWEVALLCYTDHIQMSNYDGHEAYSRELLASQIRFITELPGIEDCNRELFRSWGIVYIMEAISGDDFRETRHKLARLVVLFRAEEHSGFSVWNSQSRRAADLMLHEFGAEDPGLACRLNELIAKAKQRKAKEVDDQRKYQRKVDDVLAKMK